jgi:SEC-C motif
VPTSDERSAAIEGYSGQVLRPWLAAKGIDAERARGAVADIGLRLSALAARWDNADELLPLLGPFLDIALWNDPAQVSVVVRAAVTVGVRNSALEDLHVEGLVAEEDWRDLTVAAAQHFADWDFAPGANEPVTPVDSDPFEALRCGQPVSWAAFRQVVRWQPGATVTYPSPKREPLPPPNADFESERTEAGEHVVHAMDSRIDHRLAHALAAIARGETAGLVLPSLKHISRNLGKLYRVTETVLSNGGRIQTANVSITAGRVSWRNRLAYYNHFPSDVPGVGRNDPCPCGSGKKFKRCHGGRA